MHLSARPMDRCKTVRLLLKQDWMTTRDLDLATGYGVAGIKWTIHELALTMVIFRRKGTRGDRRDREYRIYPRASQVRTR